MSSSGIWQLFVFVLHVFFSSILIKAYDLTNKGKCFYTNLNLCWNALLVTAKRDKLWIINKHCQLFCCTSINFNPENLTITSDVLQIIQRCLCTAVFRSSISRNNDLNWSSQAVQKQRGYTTLHSKQDVRVVAKWLACNMLSCGALAVNASSNQDSCISWSLFW